MEIPLIPSTQLQQKPRKPIPWLVIIVCGVIFLGLFMIVVPIVAQQRERATYRPVSEAKSEARDLLNGLGAPPGSTAADFYVANSGPWRRSVWNAGDAWLAWTHPHKTEAAFASTAAWYREKLLSKGWRAHKPADASSAEFCKNLWRFRLTSTATGYDSRLEWNIRNEPCAHP